VAGVFGLILKKNNTQILLVKRCDMPIWVLPGGGIEKNETEEIAVKREVFEETGYVVKVIRKVGIYSYENSDKLNASFECSIESGKPTSSKESKEIKFFSIDELPELISPYALTMIKDALKQEKESVVREFEKLSSSFWLKVIRHPWALFKYFLIKLGIHWNT